MTEARRHSLRLNIRSLLVIGGLWLCLGMAPRADSDHDQARRLQQAGDILPLEKILDRVQAIQAGRVIEVELEQKHGQYIYEIESVDAGGQVHEMKFDAKSGKLLSIKKDD